MSIKTTHDISRDLAITIIVSKIHSCTNDQLANMLEEFEESHFRNYFVHDDLANSRCDFKIENFNEFCRMVQKTNHS